jgi:haloacetate dehalogenase
MGQKGPRRWRGVDDTGSRGSKPERMEEPVVFDGFDEFDIATAVTTIHGRRGGEGPPVLLLHGIPESHLMWHRVAPRLAEQFTEGSAIAAHLRARPITRRTACAPSPASRSRL